MRILSFGEILWDVIRGTEHLGGAPFNFAAHAAQCGDESFMISRLGRDPLGERAFELSGAHGVDRSLIQWDDVHPTGIVDVSLVDGQPDYVIRENAAYDHIDGIAALEALGDRAYDVFYFGSLCQRNRVSAEALFRILSSRRFPHIFYDVNLRKKGYSNDVVLESLARCTIFKLNTEEVPVISRIVTGSDLAPEPFCKAVRSAYPGLKLIIITASEKGCLVYEDRLLTVPGKAVTVRDAVGAGDAFSASFMHVYASTHDASRAATVANQVGAFVATQDGAIPKYPVEIAGLM